MRARLTRQCGLSKLEFQVVIAVMAVLALVVLERLQEIQEASEKTLVETTLRNISSGLRYAMAEDIIHGEEGRIAERAGSNPVRWLEHPPAGYVGEHPGLPAPLPHGGWFFDTTRRELCYLPLLDRHLVIAGGEHLLRWRIESSGEARDSSDSRDSPDPHAPVRVAAVRVAAVPAYRWF